MHLHFKRKLNFLLTLRHEKPAQPTGSLLPASDEAVFQDKECGMTNLGNTCFMN